MRYEPVKKQLVTDESGHPTAVLIDIEEWRRIEKVLAQPKPGPELDIMKFAGLIELGEDPLAFQQVARQEWD